jgi:hypothetical protein
MSFPESHSPEIPRDEIERFLREFGPAMRRERAGNPGISNATQAFQPSGVSSRFSRYDQSELPVQVQSPYESIPQQVDYSNLQMDQGFGQPQGGQPLPRGQFLSERTPQLENEGGRIGDSILRAHYAQQDALRQKLSGGDPAKLAQILAAAQQQFSNTAGAGDNYTPYEDRNFTTNEGIELSPNERGTGLSEDQQRRERYLHSDFGQNLRGLVNTVVPGIAIKEDFGGGHNPWDMVDFYNPFKGGPKANPNQTKYSKGGEAGNLVGDVINTLDILGGGVQLAKGGLGAIKNWRTARAVAKEAPAIAAELKATEAAKAAQEAIANLHAVDPIGPQQAQGLKKVASPTPQAAGVSATPGAGVPSVTSQTAQAGSGASQAVSGANAAQIEAARLAEAARAAADTAQSGAQTARAAFNAPSRLQQIPGQIGRTLDYLASPAGGRSTSAIVGTVMDPVQNSDRSFMDQRAQSQSGQGAAGGTTPNAATQAAAVNPVGATPQQSAQSDYNQGYKEIPDTLPLAADANTALAGGSSSPQGLTYDQFVDQYGYTGSEQQQVAGDLGMGGRNTVKELTQGVYDNRKQITPRKGVPNENWWTRFQRGSNQHMYQRLDDEAETRNFLMQQMQRDDLDPASRAHLADMMSYLQTAREQSAAMSKERRAHEYKIDELAHTPRAGNTFVEDAMLKGIAEGYISPEVAQILGVTPDKVAEIKFNRMNPADKITDDLRRTNPKLAKSAKDADAIRRAEWTGTVAETETEKKLRLAQEAAARGGNRTGKAVPAAEDFIIP